MKNSAEEPRCILCNSTRRLDFSQKCNCGKTVYSNNYWYIELEYSNFLIEYDSDREFTIYDMEIFGVIRRLKLNPIYECFMDIEEAKYYFNNVKQLEKLLLLK